MIQMINKLKKNQKGFTLVELIVVLVILAILAAFTIPAMLGFVDDARGKAGISQAREVYMAYTTAISEFAGDNDVYVLGTYKNGASGGGTAAGTVPTGKTSKVTAVYTSAEGKLSTDLGDGLYKVTVADIEVTIDSNKVNLPNKVSKVEYLKDGYLITIDYSDGSDTGNVTIEKTSATTIS